MIIDGIRRQARVGGAQTIGHAPSDMDLLGSMATRLSQVERELLGSKREIVEKVRKLLFILMSKIQTVCVDAHLYFDISTYTHMHFTESVH